MATDPQQRSKPLLGEMLLKTTCAMSDGFMSDGEETQSQGATTKNKSPEESSGCLREGSQGQGRLGCIADERAAVPLS